MGTLIEFHQPLVLATGTLVDLSIEGDGEGALATVYKRETDTILGETWIHGPLNPLRVRLLAARIENGKAPLW